MEPQMLSTTHRGPPASNQSLAVLDEVTLDDLQELATTNRRSGANHVKRLTERHRQLARLLAAGTTPSACSVLTGYSVSRISILQADPSFQNLLEFYSQSVDDEYLGLHEQMAGLGADALQELRHRIESEPDELGAGMLLDIVKATADRTGHGPSSSTTQNVNVNVNLADRMRKAREAARGAIGAKEIEGQARVINDD